MKNVLQLLLIMCTLLPATVSAQGTWISKGNFTGGTTIGAACFAVGNKAYIGTGRTNNANTLRNDFWEYDACTNVWTQKAKFPGVKRSDASAFAIGSKGYMGLGWYYGSGPLYKDFYEYDPSNNTWKQVADFGGTAREQACSFAIGDTGYVVAGYDGGSLKDTWAYDPVTDTWNKRTDFGGSARRDAVSFVINGKAYMGTGYDGGTGLVKDLWEFDPATNAWTQKQNFGGARRNLATAFSLGDKGYIGLGNDYTNKYNDVWEYNPLLNSWKQVANFSGSQRCLAIGFSIGCKGYMGLGGADFEVATTPDLWEFSDTSNHAPCLSATVNAGADVSICSGTTVTLSASGAGFGTYNWQPSTGAGSSVSATIVVSPTVTTSYVLSSTGGCGMDTVTVNTKPKAVAGVVSTVIDTLCEGTPGALNLTGNSSSVIQWQSSGATSGFTDISGAVNTTTHNTPPLLQTTYYRVVVDSGACADTSGYLRLFVPPALTATFTYTQSGAMFTFNSDSCKGNITFYTWDFGDGGTSTTNNPSHTYARTDTTYNVCLTIYDGSNCSFTFCTTVSFTTGAGIVKEYSSLVVYPNPVTEQLTISATGTGLTAGNALTISDVLGRTVLANSSTSTAQSTTINVSALPAGVYFITLRGYSGSAVNKFVKK